MRPRPLSPAVPRCPAFRSALALAVLAACCAAGPAGAASYRVELKAPGVLSRLLSGNLDLFRYRERGDINPDQLNFMVSQAPKNVAALAATEGYFSTTTTVEVDHGADPPLVRLRVEAGPRTHVTAVDLKVTGPAATEAPARVRRLSRNWLLEEGEPFRQQEWDEAKDNALNALRERRYAAARIAGSEAAIYPERQAAELSVTYDSGPAFTLGPLRITGTKRYPERIIENVNPLRIGEEYRAERLQALQRAIQRTPYFSNAVVDIDEDPANADQAPVEVRVTEFRTQRIRAGGGYTTDTGARLEARYSHFNTFGRAWVTDFQARLEQRRQLGALDLSMPPGRGGHVNSAHASLERTTLEGVELNSRRVGLRRAVVTDTRDHTFSLEFYRDELQQLSGAPLPPGTVVEPGAHKALLLGYSLARRNVDDPRFPRRGNIINAEAGVAVKPILTDQTFIRLYGKLRHFRPVGRTDILILRAELGAVMTKDGGNASIPASLLFRAGGTESVRGYSYQSIGNVRSGTVFPTRYLATGSIEYQHWFTRTWGGAVFYDAGTATDDWGGRNIFHAVGIGVRFRSPVGRINGDIGYGFEEGRLRPHLSLGVAF